jgi:hypothetical protein
VGRRAVDANDTLYRGSGRDGAGWADRGDGSGVLVLDNDFLAAVVVLGGDVGVLVGVVVVTVRVDGVGYAFSDLVSGFGDSVTKRVVVAVVVVISHITLELLGGVGSGTSSSIYSNLGRVAAVDTDVLRLTLVGVGVLGSNSLPCVTGGLLLVGVGAEVGVTLLSDDGTSALAKLAFRDVNLRRRVVGGRAVDCIEVTIVGPVLNLDVGVGGRRGWGLVAVARSLGLGLSVEFYTVLTLLLVLLLRLSWLPVASLLVDVDFFTVLLGTTDGLLLVDVDLLLDVSVEVDGRLLGLMLVLVDGGGEGFVGFFVTFPSV